MTLYTDAILPTALRFGSTTAVRYSVQQTFAASGYRKANERWDEPLRTFRLQYKRPLVDGALLTKFYEALGGPANEFLLRDWAFWHTASNDDSRPAGVDSITFNDAPLINPNTSPADNLGDGSTTVFNTYVTRTVGSASRTHQILHPDSTGFLVAIDGSDASGTLSSVDLATGDVTFSAAPGAGLAVTWGGMFYRAGHFEDNIEEILRNFEVNAYDLVIQEARGV